MTISAIEFPSVVANLLSGDSNIVVKSRAGTSTVYTINQILKDQGKECVHIYLDDRYSPLDLFIDLEENSNKTIIFNLFDNTFNDDDNSRHNCLSVILKAALDREHIQWISPVKNISYKFTGQIIFIGDTSNIPNGILDRCNLIEVA